MILNLGGGEWSWHRNDEIFDELDRGPEEKMTQFPIFTSYTPHNIAKWCFECWLNSAVYLHVTLQNDVSNVNQIQPCTYKGWCRVTESTPLNSTINPGTQSKSKRASVLFHPYTVIPAMHCYSSHTLCTNLDKSGANIDIYKKPRCPTSYTTYVKIRSDS